MAFKKNNNEDFNRKITIGSLAVIALVGLYFIFGQSSQQADAQIEPIQAPVATQEQMLEPQEQLDEVVQAPVELEDEHQQESLGASSSGLGR